jgi:hypothetical protein
LLVARLLVARWLRTGSTTVTPSMVDVGPERSRYGFSPFPRAN